MANETYIAAYVAEYGPISVAVQATQNWQQYKGGVLTSSCGSRNVDHAVVIVGYGTDSGQDYWLIRNSWGTQWGESGYVRLSRGVNCNGVAEHGSSALFQNRSMCLEKCDKGSGCCGGDCCPNDSEDHKCCTDANGKATGCCASPSTCCGASGNGACCSKASFCCGGMCCDPSYGVCSKDGSKCCAKADMCGDECCAGIGKCCKSSDGKKASCTKSITDTCCDDGTSCSITTTCCEDRKAGTSKCCPFMSQCLPDGTCKGTGVNLSEHFVQSVIMRRRLRGQN